MRKRPNHVDVYMAMAYEIATLSHDDDTQVGAVLVDRKNGAIIASSYNGHVRGAPDDLPTTRPDKYKHMIHAEQNLITNCARLGIKMKHCTVICTHTPCEVCMRLLHQAGVSEIIADQKYKDFDTVAAMPDIKITSQEIDGRLHVKLGPVKEKS